MPHIGVTLLEIMRGLNSALDLDDLLGCFMNDLRTSELAISNPSLADNLWMISSAHIQMGTQSFLERLLEAGYESDISV
ncbi:hypothetical protein Tco_1058684 [Tanacetum coccineum]|uniref:Uncharacterized protein n=1 Tax=Tanacetum coccineum TaxID=301880 RepID=A0ABQ5HAP9_9ASTR